MTDLPLFRTTDPRTSKSAAARAVGSGQVASHEALILQLVREGQGRTAKMLAAASGGVLDQVAVSRRIKAMISKNLLWYGVAAKDGCQRIYCD